MALSKELVAALCSGGLFATMAQVASVWFTNRKSKGELDIAATKLHMEVAKQEEELSRLEREEERKWRMEQVERLEGILSQRTARLEAAQNALDEYKEKLFKRSIANVAYRRKLLTMGVTRQELKDLFSMELAYLSEEDEISVERITTTVHAREILSDDPDMGNRRILE